jgi:hypothetical protein
MVSSLLNSIFLSRSFQLTGIPKQVKRENVENWNNDPWREDVARCASSEKNPEIPSYISPVGDCVVMVRNLRRVILNEVKNLGLSISSKRRDPSAAPQDDIATQSLAEETREGA